MYSLTTQCYWLLPLQQSTCQLAYASLKAIRFQTGQVYKPCLINLQCAKFTAGFQYYSLLSNELAEQATLREKTEYKRTSKDEHRQLLVSPSLIISAEPKLQS